MPAPLSSTKLLKLPIHKLRQGMFIEQFEDGNSKLNITNSGQIRHSSMLEKLKKHKIKYAWVNVERSAPDCGLHPTQDDTDSKLEIKPNEPQFKQRNAKQRQLLRAQQQTETKTLLSEAKGLVRKVLSETFEGKAIELTEFENMADKMIRSALTDIDAFKCVAALRTKDAYLLEHSINVAFLLVTFGNYMKLPAETIKEMAVGGLLHDIGKIHVDDTILNKPGKLSPEEYDIIKQHQFHAIDIVENIPNFSQISKDVCLMHHEKLDGKGYPKGLCGDQLPQHGRMSCIVDIYDALTATRCYKEAMSPASAFKILLSLTPFHLDKDLVYEFIRCIGVYPTGSLVELSDGRVGIVWDSLDRDVLHPVVKCFYSAKLNRYVEIEYVDLLEQDTLNIERGVSPRSLNVDPNPFY
ncbi:HD-GYP domain-containing protein [Parashewanella curva]|uniref:HD-GYP domain-containing protein n=1 Tax=Parashewanella curva TaxID=2338552 RepID=A0A3L8PU95_9GAMM|nr:HD-GYP domain-containing protein [Parashewanella curva]RLV58995.1 HD-GYP domain-containing protein [Parashewanella curva]